MNERSYGCSSRALLGFFAIILAICGCISSLTLVVDSGCYNSMVKKIPIYPNSQVVREQHNFLQAFGSGETLMILETDDPPSVVRDWYGKTVGAAYKAAQDGTGGDPFFYFANARYSIAALEDGSGTQIVLSGVCAN